MKIMMIANNDVGLYKFRKELVEELLKKNEIIISLPYGEILEPLKKKGCKFIDTPVDRRGINPIKDLKLLLKYQNIIKRENPDMVITYTIKPNVYGGMVCRVLKVPYCINITGLGTTFQNEGILKKIVITLYKIACKKAKVVYFENAENLKIFVDNQIVNKDRTCLLNGAGVNLEDYQLEEYPNDKIVKFLFIGRVMKEKGVDELFAAMKKLIDNGENCSLDILGGYEEDYKDIIEKYEKEGWLKYWGYQKDVKPFIKNSHCFVLPSWHEGMANTNLECAASGRPVITSNIHGCKEAVEDGISGFLCEKQNYESLFGVMRKFLNLSYDERKKMGINGRKLMEQSFNKKEVVYKTIKKVME